MEKEIIIKIWHWTETGIIIGPSFSFARNAVRSQLM